MILFANKCLFGPFISFRLFLFPFSKWPQFCNTHPSSFYYFPLGEIIEGWGWQRLYHLEHFHSSRCRIYFFYWLIYGETSAVFLHCWTCQWECCHLLTPRRGHWRKQPSFECFPLTVFFPTVEPTCLVMKLEEWQTYCSAQRLFIQGTKVKSSDLVLLLLHQQPHPCPLHCRDGQLCLVSFVSNSGWSTERAELNWHCFLRELKAVLMNSPLWSLKNICHFYFL